MSKKDRSNLYLVLGLIAALVGFSVFTFMWNANDYYTRSMKSIKVPKKEAEEVSLEPRARGLRESEIKKQQGNRYKTF